MKNPKREYRAVCCTHPDIGGLVAPSDCIECKKNKSEVKVNE